MAGRSLRSASALLLVSRTVSCSTSTISERPYIFFRCGTGTLPLRKPLSCTRSFISSRRSAKRLSSSPAGTTTCSVRFRPSLLVSVICIVLQPARKADGLSFWRFIAWCGRRDLNPHALRRLDLNQVRLPISPRPRVAPASMAGLRQSTLAIAASSLRLSGTIGRRYIWRAPQKATPLCPRPGGLPKFAAANGRPLGRKMRRLGQLRATIGAARVRRS